ncbi:hypothetical protein [Cupriavidus sp. H18C2]|uniref:hypothetical protein n=1 Tax=Cupriavidus sp. H18C2 TaxID=3241602 RepID=UPI003BF7DD42
MRLLLAKGVFSLFDLVIPPALAGFAVWRCDGWNFSGADALFAAPVLHEFIKKIEAPLGGGSAGGRARARRNPPQD